MAKVKPEHTRRRTLSDPLTAALQPPTNESLNEREIRLKAEMDAKKVSDCIDDMIRQDRMERKRTKPEVNVLLLGQSESGKSTTLKRHQVTKWVRTSIWQKLWHNAMWKRQIGLFSFPNTSPQFQLLHTPAAFHAERIAWRAVIYLNLVRSVRRILDALAPESDALDDHDDDSMETASVIITSSGRPPSAILGTQVPHYESYRQRLEPLVALEERLTQLLSSPDEDEPTHLGTGRLGWHSQYNGGEHYFSTGPNGRPAPTITIPQKKQTGYSGRSSSSLASTTYSSKSKGKEISVHTSTNWKKAFSLGNRSKSPKSAHTGEIEGWWEDPEDPVHALNACSRAMQELWRDQTVKQRLKEKRIRLEESSGFYLNEIPRITAMKYIPTDADVLKARLKTTGVVEHTFSIQSGSNRGVDWRIYDVGGSRNQRHAWAPYFDDVNAIIFLAPISAFDQVLVEDPHVNRLEDSLHLWKSVVSNKLLAHVNIVLFLNKCDLLQAKLEAGVRLSQHMTNYADRANDYDSVSKYFRNKFGAVHQSYTPNKERELYIHLTAVTDTRRTATIISTIRDIIIKGNLRTMRLV